MTTIINAVSGTGLTQSADGSGVVKLQSNGVTTNALAWVNFNGNTGGINSSYNISSVTRNNTGNYTVNYAVALTNANYSIIGSSSQVSGGGSPQMVIGLNQDAPQKSTVATNIYAQRSTDASLVDPATVSVAVFGN